MRQMIEEDIVFEPSIRNVIVGSNVIVKDGCQLSNVVIGDNTRIGRNVTIYGSENKPVIIGKDCYIPFGCYFSGSGNKGQIIIGDNVIFTPYCVLVTGSGPYSGALKSRLMEHFVSIEGDITIRNHCWIMTRSTILPDIELGECTAVAAHSVVTQSFEGYELIGGIPARTIRSLDKR